MPYRKRINTRAGQITVLAIKLMGGPDRQGSRNMAIKARDNANMALNAKTDEGAAMFLTDAENYLHDAQ